MSWIGVPADLTDILARKYDGTGPANGERSFCVPIVNGAQSKWSSTVQFRTAPRSRF
jgi:hypothetical protein